MIRFFQGKYKVRQISKNPKDYPKAKDLYKINPHNPNNKRVYEILDNFTTRNSFNFRIGDIVLLHSTLCFRKEH
jgi:hypothetical protein